MYRKSNTKINWNTYLYKIANIQRKKEIAGLVHLGASPILSTCPLHTNSESVCGEVIA